MQVILEFKDDVKSLDYVSFSLTRVAKKHALAQTYAMALTTNAKKLSGRVGIPHFRIPKMTHFVVSNIEFLMCNVSSFPNPSIMVLLLVLDDVHLAGGSNAFCRYYKEAPVLDIGIANSIYSDEFF